MRPRIKFPKAVAIAPNPHSIGFGSSILPKRMLRRLAGLERTMAHAGKSMIMFGKPDTALGQMSATLNLFANFGLPWRKCNQIVAAAFLFYTERKQIMRAALLAGLIMSTSLSACASNRYGTNGAYGYNRPEAARTGYYADRHYRDGSRYRERRLASNDRIYVGQDGRYYCRRNDGTTGLIVGGIAGGVLGGIIAPGGSETLGALLGAAGGAVAGRAIDRDNVRCR